MIEGKQVNLNTLLLAAVIALGGVVWTDISNTLKIVRALELSRIADSKDIADLQRRVNMLEQAKGRNRSELLDGNPRIRFSVRARGREHSGGPFSVPHKDPIAAQPEPPTPSPQRPKEKNEPPDDWLETGK